MKVLLIGDNEFIAESLIKGFLIEKDEIILIGSLDENKINSSVMSKIKFYPESITSEKIEDIFIVNSPDAVVYFDNAYENLDSEMTESQRLDHVNNLMNAHFYSLKAKVSKFIYISSTKLSEPATNKNSEWYKAHSSCELFLNDFDLNESTKCIILRVAELYGYGYDVEHSIISRLVQSRIYENDYKDIEMDTNYDFVHVVDFCATVRRSLYLNKSQTLNITSGYKIPSNIVRSAIENILWVEEDFVEKSKKPGLDSTKTAELIGYTPKLDFLEGIKEVYNAEVDYKNANGQQTFQQKVKDFFAKVKKTANKTVDVTNHLLSLALGILMIFFITRGYKDILGLIDIKLLYVLIVVMFFDFRQAMIAVVIACVVTAYEFVQLVDSKILVLYNQELVRNIFVLAAVGLSGGLVRQRSLDLISRHKRNEISLREQLKHIKNMYYESLTVKDSLQGQIYNTNTSFGRVFNIMSQLDTLELTRLQYQIIHFAEEIMQNKYISFYLLNRSGKYLRLVSKSEALKDLPATIFVDKSEMAQHILNVQKMYINKRIDKNTQIIMAAPMFYTNKIAGVLIIHKADIEALTLSYSNKFGITASLANQAFTKAFAYHKSQEEQLYIDGTEVLKVEPFKKRLLLVNEQVIKGKTSAALLDIGTRNSKRYFEKVTTLVRDIDYVGISPTGNVLILLNSIKKKDVIYVQNRLMNNGIKSQIINVDGWAN